MARFVLTAQLQLQAPNNVGAIVSQIQNQLNGINVNVQVQGSVQAQRQIQQITQSTNQATSAADRMGRAFAVSIRRFAAFSIATRAVGLFTSTLSSAIQTSIDFERQLIKVAQVTGKGVSDLRDLTNEITKLSTGLGVSSQSLLEVTTILTQAGLSATDTKIALNSLAQAALAPNFDSITQTAEGAIAILAQFQEGVGALERQLGSINAVAGAFAVEASDLIDVIRRTGGVFKSSGGDLNELLALFTSVRATTRESAESIGTGLRTIFTRIQRPETIEFLKQFGVNLLDLEGKFIGPYEAIRKLSEALGGLGERDITFIKIAEELGGFRQIGKVLPLLQQFATAEAALNVATKANNSLSQDAASAQAALAVRIMKVKEEFLALVRGITETSTFQVMANTALTLASALIKIADSIKPLLPLLAAVAAFRAIRGIGTFVGSTMAGLQSGRTFNQGGKVHRFATGGLVPGVGNSDTVPAMLSPGEFVIRKSSVQKLGASNLAGMNSGGEIQRFKDGTTGRGVVGATASLKSKQVRDSKFGKKKDVAGSGNVQFDVQRGQIGAFVLTPPKGTEGGYTASQPYPFTLPPNSKYAKIIAAQSGLSVDDLKGGINATINPTTYPIFYPGLTEGRQNLSKNAQYAGAVHRGFLDGISAGVNSTVKSVSAQGLLDLPPGFNTNENLLQNTIGRIQNDNQVRSSIEGYLFEGMISAFTGASAAGGKANFDFPRSAISQNKNKLGALFGSQAEINKLIKAEAKRSYGEVGGNIQRKLANDIAGGYIGGVKLRTTGQRKKMATGGGVGTDTVPALLTPGEFVVNRASSQRIGYGNLNRMNKVGKYANGGIVQRFGSGATGTGVKPATGSGSAMQPPVAGPNTQVIQQATQATSNFGLGLSLVSGSLQAMIPPIDENSSLLTKLSSSFLSMTTTIAGVIFALEAFGVKLSMKSITDFATTGRKNAKGGLGDQLLGFKQNDATGMIQRQRGAKFGEQFNFAAGGGDSKRSARAKELLEIRAQRKSSPVQLGNGRDFLDNLKNETTSMNLRVPKASAGTGNLGRTLGNLSQKGGIVGKAAGFAGKTLSSVGGTAMGSSLGPMFATLAANLGPLTVGIGAATIAFSTVKGAMTIITEEIYGNAKKLKEAAIESGNVEEAKKQAINETGPTVMGDVGSLAAFTAAGAALGSFVPIIGTAAGALAGAFVGALSIATNRLSDWATGTSSRAGEVAAAQAGAIKATKELAKGEQEAARAMEDFKNGTKSAQDVLMAFKSGNSEVANQIQRTNTVVAGSMSGRSDYGSGKIARNLGAYLGGGLFGMETAGTRNKRLETEGVDAVKSQRELQTSQFSKTSEARNAAIRSGFARGKSKREIESDLKGAGVESSLDLSNRAATARQQASEAKGAGNLKLEAELTAMAEMFDQQSKDMDNAFKNIELAVKRAKESFDAMSLGLRSATATASAQSASMTRFAAGLEVGGSTFGSDVAFLQEAMSSAAQAMDPEEIKKATDNVAANLAEFGVDPKDIDKFKGNTSAFIQAQANYGSAFDNIKAGMAEKDFENLSPDELKKKFAAELSNGLVDVPDDIKNNLRAVIENVDLNEEDVAKVLTGDLSVFGDKLSETQKKMMEDVQKIAQERQKAEQVLIDLTKKRIDAERNVIEAQKQSLALTMEGREIQSKYGGKVVTNEERKQNVLDKANANRSELGLGNMKSGSLAEIRARNDAIKQGFSAVEGKRIQQGGMEKVSGVKEDENQKDLQQAYKDQIGTIRDLIKLEEENLKIISEKNKLEKDSVDALVNGDIDKFMQTQATIGATAAIATGNQSLMNSFGADALGAAAQDIKRQQEAGVGSLYGMQLSGQGGLTQQAYSSALSARGVTDPRLAQVASGTTGEEEAAKSRLRDYGTALDETGKLGIEMAEMQLNTAEINVKDATVIMENAQRQGNAVAAVGKANGGLIYANRGMFIPRGTDTVPAMLTPGEFVVRREAVNRGNNLQLLQQMNGAGGGTVGNSTVMGFARGGRVQYYANGGVSSNGPYSGFLPETFDKLISTLGNVMTYVKEVSKAVQALPTTISHTIGDTKVDVNVMGGNVLGEFAKTLKSEVMSDVSKQLANSSLNNNGKLQNTGVLG
jgi:TP901 family phage tail tape measure protein